MLIHYLKEKRYLKTITQNLVFIYTAGVWINQVNGKSYVGSSVNLGHRLKQYYSVSYLNRKKSVSSISRALVKYGHSNFKLEILEYCEPNRLIILEREQYYIDLLKPLRAPLFLTGIKGAGVRGRKNIIF